MEQESLADAKVARASARQQRVYEGRQRRNLWQINNVIL